MSFFEQNNSSTYDHHPILLIDKSGSTKSKMESNDTILETMGLYIKKKFEALDIADCKVIFWSNEVNIIDINKPVNISDLLNQIKIMKPNGGTDLSIAFHALPKQWLNETKINSNDPTDIYILTDGDINRDEFNFSTQIKDLLIKQHKNIRLFILTVENNDKNYVTDNYEAGSKLYQIIKENKLTSFVKKFESYNNIFINMPHVNINNPDVDQGYIPFRDNRFKITDTHKFINYISETIEKLNKDELIKLLFDLSPTIHHLLKSKAPQIKNALLDTFASVISKVNILTYSDIRNMLASELIDFDNGMACSFQEYRTNRQKLFDRAQNELSNNVVNCLTSVHTNSYVSLPFDNNVILYSGKVTEPIHIGNNTYKNAGVKFISQSNTTYVVPVIPMNVTLPKLKENENVIDNELTSTEFNNQCLRQWIRANYSVMYNVSPESDFILYMCLTDMMKIINSDLPNNVKDTYRNIGKIMLNRRRFGSNGVHEIEYLLNGNSPSPVFEAVEQSNNEMINIFDKCIKLSELHVNPYTLWYAIVIALGNPILHENQLKYCKNDIELDLIKISNPTCTINDLFVNDMEIYNIQKEIIDNEYYCYITLNDTSQTGGWRIPSHNINSKVICSPRYVISEEGLRLNNNDHILCPLCYTNIETKNLIKIQPEIDNNKTDKLNININLPQYDVTNHEIIDIKDLYSHNNIMDIITLDQINFKSSYELHSVPILRKKMSGTKVIIKTESEFINTVKQKYPFLYKINFENICIAGGFCRSILLNQAINDIDMFFIGITDNIELEKRLKMLVGDIINSFDDKTLRFMIIYKENNSVYELLVLKPNSNEIDISKNETKQETKQGQNLSVSENYGLVGVSNTNGTQETKQEIESLFLSEDNVKISYPCPIRRINADIPNKTLADKYTTLYKIQIVLTKNETITDLFNNFDLYSSCVAYDLKHDKVLLNYAASYAYKYMINVINEKQYSDQFNERLVKYCDYGFSIGLPELNLDKIVQIKAANEKIEIDSLNINVSSIDKNIITYESIAINDLIKSNNINALYNSSIRNSHKALYNSTIKQSSASNSNVDDVLETTCEYITRINNTKHWNQYRNGGPVNDPVNKSVNKSEEISPQIFYKLVDNTFDVDITNYYYGRTNVKFVEKIMSHIEYDWYKNMRNMTK